MKVQLVILASIASLFQSFIYDVIKSTYSSFNENISVDKCYFIDVARLSPLPLAFVESNKRISDYENYENFVPDANKLQLPSNQSILSFIVNNESDKNIILDRIKIEVLSTIHFKSQINNFPVVPSPPLRFQLWDSLYIPTTQDTCITYNIKEYEIVKKSFNAIAIGLVGEYENIVEFKIALIDIRGNEYKINKSILFTPREMTGPNELDSLAARKLRKTDTAKMITNDCVDYYIYQAKYIK